MRVFVCDGLCDAVWFVLCVLVLCVVIRACVCFVCALLCDVVGVADVSVCSCCLRRTVMFEGSLMLRVFACVWVCCVVCYGLVVVFVPECCFNWRDVRLMM